MADRDLNAHVRLEVDDAQPIDELVRDIRALEPAAEKAAGKLGKLGDNVDDLDPRQVAQLEGAVNDLAGAGRKAENALDDMAKSADRTDRDVGELEGEVKDLSRALDKATRDLEQFKRSGQGLDRLERSFSQVKVALSGVGAALGGVAAFDALREGITVAMDAIIEKSRASKEALEKVEIAIKTTGGAAGLSAPEVAKIATSLEKVTSVSDELILKMQAVLLHFTSIGEDIFPRASEAALDVARALGIDLSSAADLVGAALQDPIKALDELEAKGVEVQQSQRDLAIAAVLAGDKMKAQEVILSTLEGKFGGTARAAREDLGGALDAVQNAFDDLLQKIGEGGLSAAVADIANQMTESGSTLGEAAEKLGTFLGTLVFGLSAFVKESALEFDRLAKLGLDFDLKMESVAARALEAFSSIAGALKFDEISQKASEAAEKLRSNIALIGDAFQKNFEESQSKLVAGITTDLGKAAGLWTKAGEAAADSAKGTREGAEALSEAASPAKVLAEALEALTAKLKDLEKVKLVEEKKKIQQLLDGYKKLGAEAPPELLKLANALGVVDSETEALLKKQADKVKEFVAQIKAAMGGLSEDQVRDAAAIRAAWEQIDPSELRNRFAALGDAERKELRERFEQDVAAIRASGGEVTQEMVTLGQQIGVLVAAYKPVGPVAQSAADGMREHAKAAKETTGPSSEAALAAKALAEGIEKAGQAAEGAGAKVKDGASKTKEAADEFTDATNKVGESAGALEKQGASAEEAAGKLTQAGSAAKDVSASQDAMASSMERAAAELERVKTALAGVQAVLEAISNTELDLDASGLLATIRKVSEAAQGARQDVLAIAQAAEES